MFFTTPSNLGYNLKHGWQSHRRHFAIFVMQAKYNACNNDLDQWIWFFCDN